MASGPVEAVVEGLCAGSAPVDTEGEAAFAAAAGTGCPACPVPEEAAEGAGGCPPDALGVAAGVAAGAASGAVAAGVAVEAEGVPVAVAAAAGAGEASVSAVLPGGVAGGGGVVSAAVAGGVEAGSAGVGAGGSAAGGAEAAEGGMGARPPSGRQRRPRGSEYRTIFTPLAAGRGEIKPKAGLLVVRRISPFSRVSPLSRASGAGPSPRSSRFCGAGLRVSVSACSPVRCVSALAGGVSGSMVICSCPDERDQRQAAASAPPGRARESAARGRQKSRGRMTYFTTDPG